MSEFMCHVWICDGYSMYFPVLSFEDPRNNNVPYQQAHVNPCYLSTQRNTSEAAQMRHPDCFVAGFS